MKKLIEVKLLCRTCLDIQDELRIAGWTSGFCEKCGVNTGHLAKVVWIETKTEHI